MGKVGHQIYLTMEVHTTIDYDGQILDAWGEYTPPDQGDYTTPTVPSEVRVKFVEDEYGRVVKLTPSLEEFAAARLIQEAESNF